MDKSDVYGILSFGSITIYFKSPECTVYEITHEISLILYLKQIYIALIDALSDILEVIKP